MIANKLVLSNRQITIEMFIIQLFNLSQNALRGVNLMHSDVGLYVYFFDSNDYYVIIM